MNMRPEITKKLELFVTALYPKFKDHPDRLVMCAVALAEYINYLVEKGIALSSEKNELLRSSLDIVEVQFKLEIPDSLKIGFVDVMKQVNSYEYETIGYFINQTTN